MRKGTEQFVDERSRRTYVSKHFKFIIRKLQFLSYLTNFSLFYLI